jgi:hypothetical protein
MVPGDLWCLDTSYVHSIQNYGNKTRVLITIECNINEKIKTRLPNSYKAELHSFQDALILGLSLAKAIFVNSIKNLNIFWNK